MKKFSELVAGVLRPAKTLADVDPGVSTILDQAIADYRSSQQGIEAAEVTRRVEAGKAAVAELLTKCESPIEKMIVPSLVFQPYGANGPWVPADAIRQGRTYFSPVRIEAQASIHDSRFDFLMMVLLAPGADIMIAVECDGRDFHSTGKDFYRDRNWSRAGIPTVRLTGSDINRAPRMAASRVAEFVLQEMLVRGLA